MLIILGLILAGLLLVILVVHMASAPDRVLLVLALVVSIVGINVHFGVTIYLSRIVLITFVIALFVRSTLGKRCVTHLNSEKIFVKLFALILFFQLISVMCSSRVPDGLRQVFIYVSMMSVFIAVIIVDTSVERIIAAIKIYLVVGVVQGLYGIYMVVGAPFKLPMYQTLMAGLPVANDQTNEWGTVYSGSLGTFRALGFFPADPSHYAGYMAGILILAIAFIAYNSRSLLPYLVMFIGGIGLLLSFSRSGILTFIVFGLPISFFLLSRVSSFSKKRLRRSLAVLCFSGIILIGIVGQQAVSAFDIKLPNAIEILSERMDDVLNPGENTKKGSMELHIMTKVAALHAWASSPLIGVGLGVNASPWYSDDQEIGWGGSHSHHLDILGQTGLMGAVLQFLLMALVFRYMWTALFLTCEDSQERYILAGLLSVYITILLGNFMYHYFMLDFVWFLMGIGMALSREIKRKYHHIYVG